LDAEDQNLTPGYRHHTRTLVRCYQVIGRRGYLNVVECARQLRQGNSEQQPSHCKGQHQFYEGKALSHAPG
jgi:hypothetical protein